MTPDEYSRAIEIVLQAIDIPGDERDAWLDAVCESEPGLRDEIDALLAAHEADSSLLDTPIIEPWRLVQVATEHSDALPTSSDYRFMQRIGRGATGDVYEAWQIRPGRQVAIKVLREEYAAPALRDRFEYEAEILASFRHRNIATIFAVGACDDGRPLLAMEHVEGAPLLAYVKTHNIDLAGRLDLMIQLCEGVQHAHTRQIIHRDLKPSNVLVTEVDGEQCVKIIDFGIGRSLSSDFNATVPGQLIGTPSYMSPEQAGMSDEPLTTRSDVYSLGVIMFELLTGTLPFTVGGSDESVTALLHKKRSEDAPRPSARARSERHTPQICAARAKQLRGDLDAIVGKALQRDAQERYETAAELRSDIERHINGLPVTARRPTVRYELSRLARRHKVLTGALAVLLIVTTIAAVLVISAQQRSARAAIQAIEQSNRASIALAASATAQGDAVTACLALDEMPADVRSSIAWRALDGLARGAQWSQRIHPAGVAAVARTHDGFLAADRDGAVWRMVSGALDAGPVLLHDDLIRDLAVAPAGDWAAFVDAEGILTIFNPSSGTRSARLDLGDSELWRLLVTDENRLVARSDHALTLIDVETLRDVWSVQFEPVGDRVALAQLGDLIWTTGSEGELVGYRAADGSRVAAYDQVVDVVAFAPVANDALIVATQNGNLIQVMPQVRERELVATVGGLRINHVAVDVERGILVVTGTDGEVSVRHWPEGQEFGRLPGHTKRIWISSCDANGLCLFGDDGAVSYWRLTTDGVVGRSLSHYADGRGLLAMLFAGGALAESSLSLEPDEVLLGRNITATAGFDGTIALWQESHWQELWRGGLHPMCAPQVSAEAPVLAWATRDQRVLIWSVQGDVRELGRFPGVTAIAVSDDGNTVYCGTKGQLSQIDLANGVRTTRSVECKVVRSLAIGAEDEVLVGCQTGRIIRWNTVTNELTTFGHGPEGVSALMWNDGAIVTGHEDGSLAFWAAGSTYPARVNGGLPSTVRRLWVQDGQLLVAYTSGAFAILGE